METRTRRFAFSDMRPSVWVAIAMAGATAYCVFASAMDLLKNDERAAKEMLARIERRFGDHARAFGPSAEHRGREVCVLNARARIADPELHFFLALLLNVPAREPIMRLVAEPRPAQIGLAPARGQQRAERMPEGRGAASTRQEQEVGSHGADDPATIRSGPRE